MVTSLATDLILGGRYRLVRRIASGGMASVWEAEDSVLHRRVAVKVLSEALAADERFLERFRREARAAAGLSHPNVAGVFDYGEDTPGGSGRPPAHSFIVMELIEGETLAERLHSEGALPVDDAVRIAGQVAAALQVAHHAGIVHRDVKPGNIMLTATGGVKVMDFGIAAASWAASITTTGATMGTASYVSPEQAAGLRATPPSDIYSLGVVLYEMLTGLPPFTGESPVAVAAAHVSNEPRPVQALAPHVPAGVAEVCMRALAKDPADRPVSAAEMAAMLHGGAAATIPISGAGKPSGAGSPTAVLPSAGSTQVLPRPAAQAARGIWIAVGAAALLALLIFGLVRLGAREPSPPAKPGGRPSITQVASVAVPAVAGLSPSEATAALQKEGLVVGGTSPAEGREGVVVGTNPPAGRMVPVGTHVTLLVGEKKHGRGHHGEGGGD
jgi:tRNA A-37 threonylcarbamoyl transferase component Bud32